MGRGACEAVTIRDDIKRDEGCRLEAYLCPAGVPTIGYGHTGPEVCLGQTITQAKADALLDEDIGKHGAELQARLPWVATAPERVQRGLLNMAFNLGLPRLLGFKKMLSALQAGLWETAAREALNSTWAAQVGKRAERIADLFRGSPGA